MLGFLHHHYSYHGVDGAGDQGDRIDLSFTGQAALALKLSGRVEVQVLAGVMVTPRQRLHRIGDHEVWRTTFVRGMLGIFLAYVFGG